MTGTAFLLAMFFAPLTQLVPTEVAAGFVVFLARGPIEVLIVG